MKLIGDRIAVSLERTDNKTNSGIVIAMKEEVSQIGEVKAIGTGRILQNGQTLELSVKVGDKVLVEKFAGTNVEIEGEDLCIIKESDIILIL